MPRKPKIADDVFVATWNESQSIREVADALEMKFATTVARGISLRKRNVGLKSFAQKPTRSENDTKFIGVWNTSKSPAEAAEKLSLSKASAQTVACRLRKRGVDLKHYKHISNVTDIDFAQIWNSSQTPAVAAKTLDMELNTAHARALRLRKQGVVLKSFPNRGGHFDKEAFLAAWNASSVGKEVAAKLNISLAAVYLRGRNLRLAGETLKVFTSAAGGYFRNPDSARLAGYKGLLVRKDHSAVRANAFIEVWNTTDSQEDAAKRLGISVASLRSRASVLRGRGLEVKKYPRGRKTGTFPAHERDTSRDAEIVEVWNNSDLQKQAADTLHLTVSALRNRATLLQSLGFAMKKYPRGRKKGVRSSRKVPVASQPEAVQPEAVQPEAVQPEAVQPEVSSDTL